MPQLNKEAFGQVPGGHSGRIKRVNDFQDRLEAFDRDARIGGEFLERHSQIAIVVQIADDHLPNRFFGFTKA